VVYPIKSKNAAEQEATQDSTVIFLAPEFADDSSSGNPERLYTQDRASQELTLDHFRLTIRELGSSAERSNGVECGMACAGARPTLLILLALRLLQYDVSVRKAGCGTQL
jgi:hypothetical protein